MKILHENEINLTKFTVIIKFNLNHKFNLYIFSAIFNNIALFLNLDILKFLFTIIGFLYIIPLSAQQANKYPVEFGQFMNTTILYNPAAQETHDHINFQAGILQYIGPFKSINTYYSTLSF